MERNSDKKLDKNYVDFPGKMDHPTCISFYARFPGEGGGGGGGREIGGGGKDACGGEYWGCGVEVEGGDDKVRRLIFGCLF